MTNIEEQRIVDSIPHASAGYRSIDELLTSGMPKGQVALANQYLIHSHADPEAL